MKLLAWNVNGIRAVNRGGFGEWFAGEKADVVCVQEIKAFPEQLDEDHLHPSKYHSFWHPAKKAGYSGVATFSKKEPLKVQYGIGVPKIDDEGRVLVTEYPNLVLINAYFPNSQAERKRLDYKLFFCAEMHKYTQKLRAEGKNVAVCGDFNIAHTEIDLTNPKTNKDNAGFLPEERAWMTKYLDAGYVDTFRHFEKAPNHYTWWSYRGGARERNVGWRVDYFCVNQEMKDRLKSAKHHPQATGSDHCPVELVLKK